MDSHVKHAAHEGHTHMNHADMNHTSEMDHSHHRHGMNHTATTMDHSSHAHHGHNHAEMGVGPMCKMDMYWNWYTIDACFLSKSWHITSTAMFAGSCIGIIFLVVLVEALRRCAREWDRHIVRDWKKRAVTAAAAVGGITVPSTECCSTGSGKPTSLSKPAKKSLLSRLCPFTSTTPRPKVRQHLMKSLIYAVLLGVGYLLMLLAMYYNGYVFFCLVIGAWMGNFLFGMDTCVLDESVVGAERGCGC
ncbi:hypothetical protein TWF481_007668 [Arthrobotrys musiformis]|uniref:Copper transport protein n=1 Tax=Arthrobotrys musiformis TaxID=47236 RepID=A0AAV9WE36_9PEZI